MKDLAKSFDKMVDCMLEAENKLEELTSQRDAIVKDIGERRYNLLIKSYNRVLGVFDDAESVSLLLQELSKKRIFRSASLESDRKYIEDETGLDLRGSFLQQSVNMKTTFEKGFFKGTVKDGLISIQDSDEAADFLYGNGSDLIKLKNKKEEIARDWASKNLKSENWNTEVHFSDVSYLTEGPFNETGSLLFIYVMTKITASPMLSMSVDGRKTRNKVVEDRPVAVFSYSLKGELSFLGFDRQGVAQAKKKGLVGNFRSKKVFSSI